MQRRMISLTRKQAKIVIEAAVHNGGCIHYRHYMLPDLRTLVERGLVSVNTSPVMLRSGHMATGVYMEITELGQEYAKMAAGSDKKYNPIFKEVEREWIANNPPTTDEEE